MSDGENMGWLTLSVTSAACNAERISDLLATAGAMVVTFGNGAHETAAEDGLFEPAGDTRPLWPSTRLTGLFPADADVDEVLGVLQAGLGGDAMPAHEVSKLPDQPWERTWMDRFEPISLGARLRVRASWHRPPSEAGIVDVIIDPGMAFGTGTHASTALCLRWLDNATLDGLDVVDYGCGSGILAIAALRLGARRAYAVDHDTQAIAATRRNAERNGVTERLSVVAPAELGAVEADLVLANILAGPLIELASPLTRLLRPGGRIVLAGLLRSQAQTVADAYAPGVVFGTPVVEGDWVCLAGRRVPEGD